MSEDEPDITDQAFPAAAAGGDSNGKYPGRSSKSPFELSQEPVTAEEPGAGLATRPIPAPAYEHLGELPASYGTQSVYLVAYDPKQLFAYWDLEPSAGLGYGLRVCRADGEVESEVEIRPGEPGRYLPAGVPGGTYYVELGASYRGVHWRTLAFSARVTMPPAGLAGEAEPKFATLPFHLSFQRLLEVIHGTMDEGEKLTAALSRLQGGGTHADAWLLDALGSLNREQRQILEKLLGRGVDLAADAGASFGGSESFATGEGPGLESPAGLASAGVAGMGSEALSSGALLAGMSSESLSSGSSVAGSLGLGIAYAAMGSETLSSGAMRLASEILFSRLVRGQSLSSGQFGLSSEFWNSLEVTLSSYQFRGPYGPSSEAWRLAGVGPGISSAEFGSESLASGAAFFRSLEQNVESLSAIFSAAYEKLSSDMMSSEGFGSVGPSSGGA
jgi:hypothetical protein